MNRYWDGRVRLVVEDLGVESIGHNSGLHRARLECGHLGGITRRSSRVKGEYGRSAVGQSWICYECPEWRDPEGEAQR